MKFFFKSQLKNAKQALGISPFYIFFSSTLIIISISILILLWVGWRLEKDDEKLFIQKGFDYGKILSNLYFEKEKKIDLWEEGFIYAFFVIEGGTDEWGLALEKKVILHNRDRREIKPSKQDEDTIKNLSSKVLSLLKEKKEISPDELVEKSGERYFSSYPIKKDGNVIGISGLVRKRTPLRINFSNPLLLIFSLIIISTFFLCLFPSKILRKLNYFCLSLIAVISLLLSFNILPLWIVIFAALLFSLLFSLVNEKFSIFLKSLRERPGIYFSISPAMIGMIILVFVPFITGALLSFFNTKLEFVGLANFKEIIFPSSTSDTNFYFTLGITILWTFLNVSIHVAIGLFLALLLSDSNLRGRGIYRVLLIVPWAVPSYITALIWKWMFNTQFGPINELLKIFGIGTVDWLGRSFWTNFSANLVTNIWLGFPFMMVVSLGALQSIPAELYEAASIDGAGRWQKFLSITLPLLKPALFPAIILGTIWTFNLFNVIYLVSGGAPDNKTNILITEAYRVFRVLKRYGLAAAYSMIIFVILFVYTLITNKITRATEGAFD